MTSSRKCIQTTNERGKPCERNVNIESREQLCILHNGFAYKDQDAFVKELVETLYLDLETPTSGKIDLAWTVFPELDEQRYGEIWRIFDSADVTDVIKQISLAHCEFHGGVHCQYRFRAPVDFTGATFHGPSRFQYVEFDNHVNFLGAVFEGTADFADAKFHAVATFDRCRFQRDAKFNEALFGADASFQGVRFDGPASFSATPARSLHAALLRRLELLSPQLSQSLHDGVDDAQASDHPWTISTLVGNQLRRQGPERIAEPGSTYLVRIATLTPELQTILIDAFDPATALGREPLHLEHVPFDLVWAQCRLDSHRTYASLLSAARPARHIGLAFRSPTGFRRHQGNDFDLPLRQCLEGYLRKWNTFADVVLPQDLLEYAEAHIQVKSARLKPARMLMGRYFEMGMVGEVEWEADGEDPALLRLVNALVDYAHYCGTGIKTAQGMGQTVRLNNRPTAPR